MRRITLIILSLVFMSVILLGCQSKDSTKVNIDKSKTEQPSEGTDILTHDEEIKTVSISKLKENSTTVDTTTIFDDDSSLEVFKSAFSSVTKGEEMVSMPYPEFRVDIVYKDENEQFLYLWIGEKDTSTRNSLMKSDDAGTVYSVSEEMSKKLIDLIK